MAKKIAHTLNSAENEFQKAMQPLCRTRSSWQVWTDYIAMAAIAIANAVDQSGKIHDEREKLYMHTIRQYGEEERFQFPELFRITVDALDRNPEQDFLGELFMAFGLGDHWKGQVFTPYAVCKMMAQIDVGHDGHVTDAVKKRGWIGVHDPACGAGATLIAVRNVLVENKVSPYQALFVAQDIDRTAALMCYIQLSLLGCAGYVVIDDSLAHPVTGHALDPIKTETNDIWFTPFYATDIWQGRRMWHRADMLIRSASAVTAREPQPEPEPVEAAVEESAPTEPELQSTESGQLSFF